METVYPPGAPILPNLLRWQGLEVYEYICALAALHLRQTRRLQNLGCMICLIFPSYLLERFISDMWKSLLRLFHMKESFVFLDIRT